jgi:predicted 3-demethylubiquinone-9 3-methyltransferase (glyoxalase superfamily)
MGMIAPFLWFDNQAEEAVRFYVSVFKKSKIIGVTHYDEAGSKVSGMPAGGVMTVKFRLDGQEFTALNGGPVFSFTPAISFVVTCKTQKEIDQYWERLSAVPEAEQCGWLKDKYGVSWQIVPNILQKMLLDKDSKRVAAVTEAFMKMKKFDIAALKRAYEGKK